MMGERTEHLLARYYQQKLVVPQLLGQEEPCLRERAEAKKILLHRQKMVMEERFLGQYSRLVPQFPQLLKQEDSCLKEGVEAKKALLRRQKMVLEEFLLGQCSQYLVRTNQKEQERIGEGEVTAHHFPPKFAIPQIAE